MYIRYSVPCYLDTTISITSTHKVYKPEKKTITTICYNGVVSHNIYGQDRVDHPPTFIVHYSSVLITFHVSFPL